MLFFQASVLLFFVANAWSYVSAWRLNNAVSLLLALGTSASHSIYSCCFHDLVLCPVPAPGSMLHPQDKLGSSASALSLTLSHLQAVVILESRLPAA